LGRSGWRRLKALALVALCAAALWGVKWWTQPVHRIAGLDGPPEQALPASPPPADPAAFARGGRSRLALFVTDRQSPWLGLATGLRTIGVPFVVTTDVKEAVRHAVVLAYPTISGRHIDTAASQALRAHVENGGTLVGFEILGAGLADVFGIAAEPRAAPRKSLDWTDEAAARWDFTSPQEKSLLLVNGPDAPRAGYAWTSADADVIARFDDGSPAVVGRRHGRGHSYAVGLDLGAFISQAQQGRLSGREYVNAYTPQVDVLLRWLKAIYREGEPGAVTLGTVPQGRTLSVVLSYDVDYTESVGNAQEYAAAHARQGVRGTFFVQTKYVRDWNDDRFFDEDHLGLLRQLQQSGGELASHSVAHSPVFASLPLGDGSERYQSYAPFVKSKTETRDATLLGELRVSRFLLAQATPAPVESFRPGHLEYPRALPQALAASGYRFSSSMAAGPAMSHLPFQLSYGREGRALVPVHEFPITLEDERMRPMDTALLPRALDVAGQLARYGGMCVVLIHPNVLDDKLRFQQQFVERMKERDAWIGPLGEFAAWWTAREQVEVDVDTGGTAPVLRLNTGQPIAGLPLQLPAGLRLAGGSARATGPHGVSVDLPAGVTVLPLEAAR